jgi:hypothetical protein
MLFVFLFLKTYGVKKNSLNAKAFVGFSCCKAIFSCLVIIKKMTRHKTVKKRATAL